MLGHAVFRAKVPQGDCSEQFMGAVQFSVPPACPALCPISLKSDLLEAVGCDNAVAVATHPGEEGALGKGPNKNTLHWVPQLLCQLRWRPAQKRPLMVPSHSAHGSRWGKKEV